MKRLGFSCMAALAIACCAVACAEAKSEGFAAEPIRVEPGALSEPGLGEWTVPFAHGAEIRVKTYRATGFDPDTGPIWFVMHGATRDAELYLRAAAPVAERYGALAIVPEFDRQNFPRGTDYTHALVARGALDGSALEQGRWRKPDEYLYAEIERMFDGVRSAVGGLQSGYYLFGHSAGAQFVHGLVTFLPENRVLGAVAANAGWYVLPVHDETPATTVPYGLYGSPVLPEELQRVFSTRLTVMLGDRDTSSAETDDLVRSTPEAMAQGSTRLERGRNYFAAAKERAAGSGLPFEWRLAVVPHAAHSVSQVIESAGFLTFAPNRTPCRSTTQVEAGVLRFTELLADPPPGTAGDANGDGVRDPADDEFVEIVNAGTEPVCLTGWVLRDAKRPQRHNFPIGPALDPGGRIVVFGGGIPTGAFGGAQVNRSAKRLNLSNAGDVVTLLDPEGRPAAQVSWGDCAGDPCAVDHWSGSLDIAGSLTREPGAADWSGHGRLAGVPFSPGAAPEIGER